MPMVRFERLFDTREEAEEWAEHHKERAWGYSPSTSIRQSGDKWVVDVTQWDSCD